MAGRQIRQQEVLFQTKNLLYCGDNLEVLRLYQQPESVDLVYLDPPFKKHAKYNLLFKELTGRKAASQQKAFAATWTWDEEAISTYQELVRKGGHLGEVMEAFHTVLGGSEMLAYLAMMAPRLVELKRVLKPTGSIYLHCDPAASHYLKVLMDAIFEGKNFRNEIVWHYSGWNKNLSDHFERRTDTLLFYGMGRHQAFNSYTRPWKSVEEYVKVRKQKIRHDDNGRAYVLSDAGGGKRVPRYLDEAMKAGVYVDNVWEIDKLNNSAKEKLGYPTQKPEALLERVILASSNPGDVVLDPFCGCGTTVAVAERFGRRWIGIDITYKAIDVIRDRLAEAGVSGYEIGYEPVSFEDAERLAQHSRSDFEKWAVRRVGGIHSGSGGADKGIDGRIYFHDEPDGPLRKVIISVKSGATGPRHVRELGDVMRREKADLGVVITLREPTLAMRSEARERETYMSVYWDERYPTIQLLTVKELLGGELVKYPRADRIPGIWQLQAPEQVPPEPRLRSLDSEERRE